MASRRLAAAAAAASRSPLARLVSRPGLAGPAGRYWPEKVNLWEDPMNPMRWKASRGFRRFSTEFREPADKAVSGIEVKEAAGKALPYLYIGYLPATIWGFSTEVREPAEKAVRGIEVKEPAGKAGSGSMWNRIKHRVGTATLQQSAMARFVVLVFGLGTPTVICVKRIRDLPYHI